MLDTLRRLPLFSGLAPEQLQGVLDCCEPLTVQAGETVFRQGTPCDGFYVVVEGAVRLFRLGPDGREQVLHHVTAGGSFAEAALFRHGRFPAGAAADGTATRLIRVRAAPFLEFFAATPALAPRIIAALCSRLHTLSERIELLTHLSAGSRLAAFLMQLPSTAGEGGQGWVVELPVAKKTLAGELSVTPETLSRLLSRWAARGWIGLDGRRVELRDVAALEALADQVAPDASPGPTCPPSRRRPLPDADDVVVRPIARREPRVPVPRSPP